MIDARHPAAILAIAMLVGGCVVGPAPTRSHPPTPSVSGPPAIPSGASVSRSAAAPSELTDEWLLASLPDPNAAGTTLGGIAIAGGTAVLVGQVEAPNGPGAIGAIWTGPARLLAP
jgi:PBP1b-binding outer membrane lipoprotein LpoB